MNATTSAPRPDQRRLSIAVIGTGPRGIAFLEAMAVRLATDLVDVRPTITIIDRSELGAGRIWRTDQPPELLMNTAINEITMFSGLSDGNGCRPGAGYSFLEWLTTAADPRVARLGPNDYAPRHLYGQYLRYVYQSTLKSLAETAEVNEISGTVTAVHPLSGAYRVSGVAAGQNFAVTTDVAVIATGHVAAHGSGSLAGTVAHSHLGQRFHAAGGDSVADLNLDDIEKGSTVGLIGLGLSFYDLLMRLTEGRGGVFTDDSDGSVTYRRSGNEPVLIAGSRTGVPVLSRGKNQKTVRRRAEPRYLTELAVARLRERACAERSSPQLDFAAEIQPLLAADVNYVYYTRQAAQQCGEAAAIAIGERLENSGMDLEQWQIVAAEHGLRQTEPLDLDGIRNPFSGSEFTSPQHFNQVLIAFLANDVEESACVIVALPLKASLDMIRDLRGVLRSVVECGGLTPRSYCTNFLADFQRSVPLLFTGPPLFRTRQLMAVVAAGVLTIVGPDVTLSSRESDGALFIESPHVADSRRSISLLIDTRIPPSPLTSSTDSFMQQLATAGVARSFVNSDGRGAAIDTGSIETSSAEHRVVAADGSVHHGLYAVGIPTEGQRWFTQIGNSRPGVRTTFQKDAELVARSIATRHSLHLRSECGSVSK